MSVARPDQIRISVSEIEILISVSSIWLARLLPMGQGQSQHISLVLSARECQYIPALMRRQYLPFQIVDIRVVLQSLCVCVLN